jgi:hypothetical protein
VRCQSAGPAFEAGAARARRTPGLEDRDCHRVRRAAGVRARGPDLLHARMGWDCADRVAVLDGGYAGLASAAGATVREQWTRRTRWSRCRVTSRVTSGAERIARRRGTAVQASAAAGRGRRLVDARTPEFYSERRATTGCRAAGASPARGEPAVQHRGGRRLGGFKPQCRAGAACGGRRHRRGGPAHDLLPHRAAGLVDVPRAACSSAAT